MKKTFLICVILLVGTIGKLNAQLHPSFVSSRAEIRDTNYNGYMFNKPFLKTEGRFDPQLCYHTPKDNLFMGCRYYSETPVRIYGVSTTVCSQLWDFQVFVEDIWGMILQKDGDIYIPIDSAQAHQYYKPRRWSEGDEDHILYMPNVLFPFRMCGVEGYRNVYEYYFDEPITIYDTFYVGVKNYYHSTNGLVYITALFATGDSILPAPEDLLILENMEKVSFQDSTGPQYESARLFNPGLAFFPIIHPFEEDSVFCDTVPNFHLEGVHLGYPTVAWDTDWYREEDLYEVQYAPYRTDAWVTNSTVDSFMTVYGVFDPTKYYQARARARRHHRCPIHDTVMWGPWSEPILFYTGTTEPDTTAGINPVEAAASLFTLTPNPTTGTVRVDWGGHTPSPLRGTPPVSGGELPRTCPSVDAAASSPSKLEGVARRDGGVCITLHDAAGHEVMRMTVEKGQKSVELDLAALPKGTYLVTLATPTGTGTQRLVLQ